MDNFNLYMPTRILFGNGAVKSAAKYMPKNARVLLAYGGGSAKKNGAYLDVKKALSGCKKVVDFGGIEANPEYETCLKAVEVVKKEKLNYIVALGGGSVIDACKFIAGAVFFKKDPWQILSKSAPIKEALPIAVVLTMPATGSEMNQNAVVSRRETNENLSFASEKVIPQFS
ncbi:MAG: iron-containing alcohol dehydrogenase, partial [Opitutales bacterium]|nr:iron-containing alcohol dehydrogenase [Opitutales bacterium]